MYIRFYTWNVRSPYGAGSIMTAAKEISKYKLYLVGVQEVRWDMGSTEPVGKNTFFNRKRAMRIMIYVQIFCKLGNNISN
jgi:hypothetical protein